jgi:membrane-associated phospholipid phosphatase
MSTDEKPDFLNSLAKIFSVVFHPLLMLVYGMAIIFSAPTLFGYLPVQIKKLMFLIVLVNNVFLPVSLLPFFMHRGIISSWTVNERKERTIPLILTTLLYGVTSYIIFRYQIPLFLKSYIFSAFFLSLIVTLINLWWKVSLHSVGAGALLGIVLILSLRTHTSLVEYLILVIITGGLVLSSRLKLNYHNPQQVWLGYLTGFLGLILFMILFQ